MVKDKPVQCFDVSPPLLNQHELYDAMRIKTLYLKIQLPAVYRAQSEES